MITSTRSIDIDRSCPLRSVGAYSARQQTHHVRSADKEEFARPQKSPTVCRRLLESGAVPDELMGGVSGTVREKMRLIVSMTNKTWYTGTSSIFGVGII